TLRELILADPTRTLLEVGDRRRPITVTTWADREEAARLIAKYDLLAVPVVDEGGHLLGIVTVDDMIDTMVKEQTEDLHKLGGVEALDEPYTKIGFGMMIRKRAGWLCALFISEMLTATAMQHFEAELSRAIVLALFIPLIMSGTRFARARPSAPSVATLVDVSGLVIYFTVAYLVLHGTLL